MQSLRGIGFLILIGFASLHCGSEVDPMGSKVKIRHPGFQADRLFDAVNDGDAEDVARLVRAGADIEAKDDKGMTSLMLAVNLNKRNIVPLLVRAGAHLEEKNDRGQTALMLASMPDAAEIEEMPGRFRLMERYGGYGDSEDRPAATVDFLLREGANPNSADDVGFTALMYAYNLKKVRLLLQYGAEIDAVNQEGKTALMEASLGCLVAKVSALLDRGASKEIRDIAGKTAAELVREFATTAHQRIASRSGRGVISSEEAMEISDLGQRLECIERQNLLSLL